MDLYPAIDIRDGRCVRLLQGDFAAETVYGDPFEVARGYAESGARWLHVVDLDAARTGAGVNRELVLELAQTVPMQMQAGGGVRDAATAAELLDGGVARVVIGTAAIADPELVPQLAADYPGRVAVGLDHRQREIAVSGWEVGSGIGLDDAIERFRGLVLGAFVVTDISTDGTLAGPDLDGLRHVLGTTSVPVIASGGVGSLADLGALAALEAGGRTLAGVIVGKALLSGAIELDEAVAACG